MGGEAAKERRRLKRLQAQQDTDGKAASAPADGKPKTSVGGAKEAKNNKNVGSNEKTSAEIARLRFQRKMERKASGKFKPQSDASSPPTHKTSKQEHKRKSDDVNGKASKSTPSKMAKRGPKNQHSKQTTSAKNKFRKQNDKHSSKKPAAKKNNNAKQKSKAKKPKHLKRKMDQLSKTIAEASGDGAGASVSNLEGQMKQLAEQMEMLKKLKAGKKTEEPADASIGVAQSKKRTVNVDIADDAEEVANEDSIDNKENKECSDNSSSDDNSNAKDTKEDTSDEKKPIKSLSKSSDSSDNDSSSDEENELAEPSTTRSRGKRRRGRRDNNKQREESSNSKSETSVETDSKITPALSKDADNENTSEANDIKSTNSADEGKQPSSKKTSKKDDKRRCIGRKPVTDYTIGKVYSGTVKYIKPKLGAFIDIGSHSDAFCHISCTSNDFVSSVTDALKIGDVVENVRVVEIDREKKRISVSLRSEDMAENEQERLKTTRQYEKGLHSSRGNRGGGSGMKHGRDKTGHVRFGGDASKAKNEDAEKTEKSHSAEEEVDDSKKINADLKRERKLARRAERRAQNEQTNISPAQNVNGADRMQQKESNSFAVPGQKSGADLKRERKLARRAERRAAKEAENGGASQ